MAKTKKKEDPKDIENNSHEEYTPEGTSKKKYKRDKLIEYGLLASLILIEIFRNFFGKPNFPKL